VAGVRLTVTIADQVQVQPGATVPDRDKYNALEWLAKTATLALVVFGATASNRQDNGNTISIDLTFASSADRDRFKKIADQLYAFPPDPPVLGSADI